ncbi:MAG: hypothetical protein FJZ01_24860, partial [Candidatus Sericytochromatia bacterium]|nr:hypothetical protein [Candidatus Tanganyikabacteria bacterium]
DAQVEKRQLQPAMATADAAPFKRATTSTLSLGSPAPPPPKAAEAARGHARTAQAPRATAPIRGTGAPAAPVPPPRAQTAPVPTVLVETPAGEFLRLPAATPFTAQITTQSPESGAASTRLAAVLQIESDATVTVRDPAGQPYLCGKATTESDGRTVTLTVNYNQTGQAGQGTLFASFADGRLVYLSGSGTARDDAGRTVVRDIAAVRPAAAATTTSSRRTGPGSIPARSR